MAATTYCWAAAVTIRCWAKALRLLPARVRATTWLTAARATTCCSAMPPNEIRKLKSWLAKFGQVDRWRFCLTAARMAPEQVALAQRLLEKGTTAGGGSHVQRPPRHPLSGPRCRTAEA